VFISWCGEGVSGQPKALFSNHCQDFEDYLKVSLCFTTEMFFRNANSLLIPQKNNFAYASQINARTETDLEEENITKSLNKTSTFIRAKTTQEKAAAPQTSIKQVSSQFWNQQKQVDQQYKQQMDDHKKQSEAELARSKEAEQQRLQEDAQKMFADCLFSIFTKISLFLSFFLLLLSLSLSLFVQNCRARAVAPGPHE